MYYLEGTLEIMNPSAFHEEIKTTVARLLEAYLDEKRIKVTGIGSLTMRSAPKERGAEPDDASLGEKRTGFPDIAIEVIWTSGGPRQAGDLPWSSRTRGLDVEGRRDRSACAARRQL